MSFLDLTNTPVTSSELLPNGVYLTKISKAEVKDTKALDGQYINVQFKVIEGEHEGRVVFGMYNISNKNPKATEIGLSQLKSMLFHAGAPFALSNVTDIEGYDVAIKVGSKSDDYGDKNIIKGYTTKQMLNVSKTTGQEIPF